MKLFVTIFLSFIVVNFANAQVGGESIYSFLRLNMSSNYASLGGFSPSVDIQGVNSLFSNPALVDSSESKSAALNFVSYIAGINYGSALYTSKVGEKLMVSGCAEFLNYGNFDEIDENSNVLGTFSCKEHLFSVSFSRPISRNFSCGATLKTIFSNLESYKSSGLAFDFGFLYNIDNQKLTIGISASNFGFQLTKYSESGREKLPFDLRFGVSKTLLHAPLRFSATLHDLQKPKLDDDFLTSLADHFILSAELFPEKVVSLKTGFNFQSHNDLYVSGMNPFPGFSFGIDVRLSRFSIQYSRQCLSPAASSNLFTLELFFENFVVK